MTGTVTDLSGVDPISTGDVVEKQISGSASTRALTDRRGFIRRPAGAGDM